MVYLVYLLKMVFLGLPEGKWRIFQPCKKLPEGFSARTSFEQAMDILTGYGPMVSWCFLFVQWSTFMVGFPHPCRLQEGITLQLVGGDWNMNGLFFHLLGIRNNNPNWRTHIFQRGWNHQPVKFGGIDHVPAMLIILEHTKVWVSVKSVYP